jgi:hypothetical protein
MERETLVNSNKLCRIITYTDGVVSYHDMERNETYKVIPDMSALGFHLEYHRIGESTVRNSISFAEMKSLASLAGSNHLLHNLIGSERNQSNHICMYCQAETTHPDEECYKAPKNTNEKKDTPKSPIFKSGVSLITEERQRQVNVEGWSEKHDDYQVEEELAFAAATYATPSGSRVYLHSGKPNTWLWEKEWWKPSPENRIRELVKAGALIAAEIDRLQRKEK